MSITAKPNLTDVLLGRGVATNRHAGNENFRAIVSQHVDVYVSSTKKQKTMISRSIVKRVKTELNPPGKFLEKSSSTGCWEEVPDKRALEKTAQALRDGAATLKKQLLEDMSDPTFLDVLFDDKNNGDNAAEKPSQNKSANSKKVKKIQQRKRAASKAKVVVQTSSDSPSRPKKQRRLLDPDIPPPVQYDYTHDHYTDHTQAYNMYEHEQQQALDHQSLVYMQSRPPQPHCVTSLYNVNGMHHESQHLLPQYNDHVMHHDYHEQTYHHGQRYTTQEVGYENQQLSHHYAPTLPAMPSCPDVLSTATLLDDNLLDVLEPAPYQHTFDVSQTAVIDDDSSGNSHAE